MTQTCSKCSRPNPDEASYCYHDGALLAGHVADGGPVGARSHPFLAPFVFPSGRQCRNFDELAVACHEEWKAARELLHQGFLEKFFGGLGRADLAGLARQAAGFPDRDRGLDQLLGQLPTAVLSPPRLRAEPQDLYLGQLKVGEDRAFSLTLENQGLRLLYGTVTCDADWLALGDRPGAREKLFQFGAEAVLPVHVRGNRLRAGSKPLAGRLLVDSNGGQAAVTVRAEVPVLPFPDGALKGSLTPRELAEKARDAPHEAARLFESGAVAAWYKSNGWTYPVTGPAVTGLGAVQQFFEAHGFARAPRVRLAENALTISGRAGETLRHTLELRTDEKKHVYAHATSSQPWLEPGAAHLNGRVATLPLTVVVPDREGETLSARLVVLANNNQRFVVTVTLHVAGSLVFDRPAPAARPGGDEPRSPSPADPAPAMTKSGSGTSRAPRTGSGKSRAFPLAAAAAAPLSPEAAAPAPARPRWWQPLRWLRHLLPLLLLAAALAATLAYDARHRPAPAGGRPDEPLDPEPRLHVQFSERMRFGLAMARERDPREPERFKRLTSEEDGRNNNTRVRIDNFDYKFGQPVVGHPVPVPKAPGAHAAAYEYNAEKVRVTQTVQLVPGEQTRLLDTCLVRYDLENLDDKPHTVGLRVMLDTYIGGNDGVPFIAPGHPGLIDGVKDLARADIPDYVQALEHPDPANPGTVAHFNLRLPGYEPVERLLIAAWPGPDIGWDWTPQPPRVAPGAAAADSSVTLYWAETPMPPGERRRLGFTYGLNALSGDGRLHLTAGGDFRPGREFTVTAYVRSPEPGQKVRLSLPPSLALVGDQKEEQALDGGGDLAQVSWRVKSHDVGDPVIEATLAGHRATVPVRIRTGTIF